MLRIVGIKRNVENLFSLSQPYTQDGDYSFLGLKRAYKKFLHQIQPSVPVSFLDSIEFLKDVPRTREMISLFAEKSRLDDSIVFFRMTLNFKMNTWMWQNGICKNLKKLMTSFIRYFHWLLIFSFQDLQHWLVAARLPELLDVGLEDKAPPTK